MVNEERVKELEALDKRLVLRRRATVVFFIILSVILVAYATNIEMKIRHLSQSPAVVVYKESENTTLLSSETQMPFSIEAVSDITTVAPHTTEEFSSDGRPDSTTKPHSDVEHSKETQKQDYYVTQFGKKYHIYGCSYLNESKRKITSEEIATGGYSPCSRCIE